MNCEKTALLMTEKLAGEICPENDAVLMKHLEDCGACREKFAELQKIWKLTAETLKAEEFQTSLDFKSYGKVARETKEAGSFLHRQRHRILEYAAVLAIIAVLAGMMLPALSTASSKLRYKRNEQPHAAIEVETRIVDMKELDKIPEPLKPPEEVLDALEIDVDAAESGRLSTIKCYSAVSTSAKTEKKKTGQGIVDITEVETDQQLPLVTLSVDTEPIPSSSTLEINVDMPKLTTIKPSSSKLKIPAEYSARETRESRIAAIEKYSGGKQDVDEEKAKDEKTQQMRAEPTCPVPAIKPVSIVAAEKKECEGEAPRAPRTSYSTQKVKAKADPNAVWSNGEPSIQRKIFSSKINLKLWDLTTKEDLKAFLKKNGISTDNTDIQIHGREALTITIPEEEYDKLKTAIENLNKEEEKFRENKNGLPYIKTETKPVSTFSIDVDTASYTTTRKKIEQGLRPSPDKVRAEDFINYFDYHYQSPRGTTFGVYLQAAPSPVRAGTYIMRVGVQGKKLGPDTNTVSSYTLIIDTSGSMAAKGRLELVKRSIDLFMSQLNRNDRINLIVCGDTIRTVAVNQVKSSVILKKALSGITASGPTNLAKGIDAAYEMAINNYRAGANNKVVIFSDGIFEADAGDKQYITSTVENGRVRGISNIVIALGGDGDDDLMEAIAAKGDGSYVFIDNEEEASEIFEEQFAARFREIAKDVKIQVEFNPEFVESYRQIGYDNRQLSKADFRNDKVDAGEVGSGQSVTAIYELKLKTEPAKIKSPAATVRIRYKNVPSLEIEEREYYLEDKDFTPSFNNAADNLKLAFAAGEFAEFLKYPDMPGIATPANICGIVKGLRFATYAKDKKVEELYTLINLIK